MGTLISIYIRALSDAVATALRQTYQFAYTEPGSLFYAVDQSEGSFRCPESDLQALSKRLHTDVVWLSFQSVAGAFQYHRWSDGVHFRSLVYGSFKEGVWEHVSGIPEPWEPRVFFDPAELAAELEYIDSPDEQQKLKEVFQNHLLISGEDTPRVDARERARDIAKYYRFPGWGLTDGVAG
jgi:hypothetical protein